MIKVANKLRVYEGNIIMIPGCEPISVVTFLSNQPDDVVSLFNRFNEICPSSFITLDRAMEVVPGATVRWSHDPAFRWFVLPDGPPPSNFCPGGCSTDWYDILREGANVADLTEDQKREILGDCSAFRFDWYGG